MAHWSQKLREPGSVWPHALLAQFASVLSLPSLPLPASRRGLRLDGSTDQWLLGYIQHGYGYFHCQVVRQPFGSQAQRRRYHRALHGLVPGSVSSPSRTQRSGMALSCPGRALLIFSLFSV